jgi:hypothetical protein
MNNKKTFAEKAYSTTQVEYSKTQAKIIDMLHELGIVDTRITQSGDDYIVEFLVALRENEGARNVRINVPVIYEHWMSPKRREHERDKVFRVLFYNLKNRFVSVVNHLREFEEEFLNDLVIMNHGVEMRIGDIVAPQYKELIKSSSIPVMHLN